MDLITYQNAIERTWNKATNQNVHVHLLMKSEIGELESAFKKVYGYGRELDVENVIEELGDYYYGFFTFLRLRGYKPKSLKIDASVQKLDEDSACDIFDALTTYTMMLRHLEDEQLEQSTQLLWNLLGIILDHINTADRIITVEDVMDTNIVKLSKRYPDTFTSELSAMRLDKQH